MKYLVFLASVLSIGSAYANPVVDPNLPVENFPSGAVFKLKKELIVAAGADSAPVGGISVDQPDDDFYHTDFSCAMVAKHASQDARSITPSDSTAYRTGEIQAKVTSDEYGYEYHSTLYLPIEQSETFDGLLCQYDYSNRSGKYRMQIAHLLAAVRGRFEVVFPPAKKVAY